MGSKIKQLKKKVIGFESANSYAKVYGGSKGVVYPNTISMVALETFVLSDPKEGIRDQYTLYEFEGKKFYVGRTVNYMSSSRHDIGRYSTEEYKLESIVALSHLVENGDHITAVTGIPSTHYESKDKITKAINNNLKGTHTMKVDGEDLSFTIDEVDVTLQPLGTFFYCVINTDGSSDEEMIERFSDTKTLVIDIGWKTTDLAILFSNELIGFKNISVAMQTAYEAIRTGLKQKYPDRQIASMNIDLFDLESKIRKNPVISYANQKYDTTEVVNKVFRDMVKEILRQAQNLEDFSQYTTIVFTGGGTAAMQIPLNDALAKDEGTENLIDNIFIVSAEDAQEANPKGYYVYREFIA